MQSLFSDFSLSYKHDENCGFFFRNSCSFHSVHKIRSCHRAFSAANLANIHLATNLTKIAVSSYRILTIFILFLKFVVLGEPFNKFQLQNIANITWIFLVLLGLNKNCKFYANYDNYKFFSFGKFCSLEVGVVSRVISLTKSESEESERFHFFCFCLWFRRLWSSKY